MIEMLWIKKPWIYFACYSLSLRGSAYVDYYGGPHIGGIKFPALLTFFYGPGGIRFQIIDTGILKQLVPIDSISIAFAMLAGIMFLEKRKNINYGNKPLCYCYFYSLSLSLSSMRESYLICCL